MTLPDILWDDVTFSSGYRVLISPNKALSLSVR